MLSALNRTVGEDAGLDPRSGPAPEGGGQLPIEFLFLGGGVEIIIRRAVALSWLADFNKNVSSG